MKERKKTILISLAMLVAASFLLLPATSALAEGPGIGSGIMGGLKNLGETGFVVEETNEANPNQIVTHPRTIIFGVISVVLGMVGMLLLILLLYSGYLWLTAYGEADKADKAMKVARRAIVGIGIIMAAYIITVAGFYYLSRIAGGNYYYPAGGTADWRDHETGYEEDIYWN